jgi:hypothetical protein
MLTYVQNEHCLFTQVNFDSSVFSSMTDAEYKDAFEAMFVRLIVSGDYDKVSLMDAVSKINRAKPHDLQIINDSIISQVPVNEDEEVEEVKTTKSTLEYITTYINNSQDFNKTEVHTLMSSLYNEAVKLQSKGE